MTTNPARAWRHAQPQAIHPTWPNPEAWRYSGQLAASEIAGVAARYGNASPSTVLDYGAGAGRIAVPLAEHFRHVYAADTNRDFLEDTRFPELLNVTKLPIDDPTTWTPPTPVDVVACVNVLIHYPHDEAARQLARFRDWVWPGGLVVVQLPLYAEAREVDGWTDVNTWTLPMLRTVCAALDLVPLSTWTNPGRFTFEKPGPNHRRLHVLRRS